MKMIRFVESAILSFDSVSPFLMTLFIKPSGSEGVLTAFAGGGKGGLTSGAATEVGGDAVWISEAYPCSELPERNNIVNCKMGLFADRKVFTSAEISELLKFLPFFAGYSMQARSAIRFA
jgi:hypothetical protein